MIMIKGRIVRVKNDEKTPQFFYMILWQLTDH